MVLFVNIASRFVLALRCRLLGFDTTMDTQEERKRKSNWTKEEEVILVEEVTKREGLLFGKLDGCQRTNKKKIQAWEQVKAVVDS